MTACRCLTPSSCGEQLMHGLDVVADGHDGEARAVKGLGRVAGRGGAAVAEELRGDEKQLVGIERLAGRRSASS